jgi:copper homeostasis protein
MKVEICAINLESALAAQNGGAHRIELCENIVEGGTTPSAASILLSIKYLTIPVNVLVRPRAGDFLYSELEFETICADIEFCKAAGVKGIVIGLLNADGSVDIERTSQLVNLAAPMEVTFHRAFDLCQNPSLALEQIIAAKAHRILTSGQESTAKNGIPLIEKLVQQADGRIIIMPGGGINIHNVDEIIQKTGVEEIHLSAKVPVASNMKYRQNKLSMSGGEWATEDFYFASSQPNIAELIKHLNS